jgi:hypothetical protein
MGDHQAVTETVQAIHQAETVRPAGHSDNEALLGFEQRLAGNVVADLLGKIH